VKSYLRTAIEITDKYHLNSEQHEQEVTGDRDYLHVRKGGSGKIKFKIMGQFMCYENCGDGFDQCQDIWAGIARTHVAHQSQPEIRQLPLEATTMSEGFLIAARPK
jgi:hypothetical protein